MKIGIFGCTADPFTNAHYEIVKKVLDEGLVDRIIVIPTIVDYHRSGKKRMFSNEQRLEIIRKWFESRKDVTIDDFEYTLVDNTPSLQKDRRYYHTLMDTKIRYGKGNEYFTIIGADSWNNITSWYRFRNLGNETKFIVIGRNDQPINFYVNYTEYHRQPYKVLEMDDKLKNVSATEIRRHLKEDRIGDSFYVYLEEIEEYLKTGKTWNDRFQNEQNERDMKEETIAHTPIFDLVKGPMVEEGFKPVRIKSPDWVSIIVEKDGRFLMEKQLRHGLNKEFEEFPCGMVEEHEFPNIAALRELKEETGIEIKDQNCLHYLGNFAANTAFMTNYMHYYHVNLDYAVYDIVDTKFDEHEHLVSYWVDKKTAFDNFINSSGSAIMGCAWMLILKNGIGK